VKLFAILAQETGWSEFLLVGVPIVVFGALLLLARRRAIELASRREETDSKPG
jgi:Flp pilus assembly protein protease CpaA